MNPFVPNAFSLYPLKTSENLLEHLVHLEQMGQGFLHFLCSEKDLTAITKASIVFALYSLRVNAKNFNTFPEKYLESSQTLTEGR